MWAATQPTDRIRVDKQDNHDRPDATGLLMFVVHYDIDEILHVIQEVVAVDDDNQCEYIIVDSAALLITDRHFSIKATRRRSRSCISSSRNAP